MITLKRHQKRGLLTSLRVFYSNVSLYILAISISLSAPSNISFSFEYVAHDGATFLFFGISGKQHCENIAFPLCAWVDRKVGQPNLDIPSMFLQCCLPGIPSSNPRCVREEMWYGWTFIKFVLFRFTRSTTPCHLVHLPQRFIYIINPIGVDGEKNIDVPC